jgi:hypothetical protein
MSAAIIISVISLILVALSVTVAYLQHRENHQTKVDAELNNAIKEIAQQVVEPVKLQMADHTFRITQDGDRLNRIENLLKTISDELTKQGVKVDMYWSTLESLAMNAAKGLHQPDQRRERIDYLLEAFMENTLTADERMELKKSLVQIRNYEPGSSPPLPFPVYPGEHTLATILLSTIDIVDPARMASLGHAAHRSAAHQKMKEGQGE